MIVRPFRPDDLAFAAECAAGEGWTTETLEVFEAFFAHDPAGCLVAEEAGSPAGICIATAYGLFGFVGELIVRRAARGRNVGPRLLGAAIEHLRKRGVLSIGLDGVAGAVPFYRLCGFRPVCTSHRFSGRPGEIPKDGAGGPGRLRRMTAGDAAEVSALDRRAFGADRGFFLERGRALHPELAFVAEDGDGLAGYALARPGNGVVAVGPWVIDERWPRPFDLLSAVSDAARDSRLRIGVLDTNAAAVRLLRGLPGLSEEAPSRRMVLGPSDRLGNSPLCWAIGSPAKG